MTGAANKNMQLKYSINFSLDTKLTQLA